MFRGCINLLRLDEIRPNAIVERWADNATSSGAADGATTHAKQAIQKCSFHFGNTQPLVRMRVARDVAEAKQIAVKRNLLYYVLKKKMIYILDALAFDSVEIFGPKTITILIMIMLEGAGRFTQFEQCSLPSSFIQSLFI